MAHLSVRLKDETKAAYEEVCQKMGASKSVLVKGYIREVVDRNGEMIEDDTLFRAKEAILRDERKAWQRALHLPNNFHEELETQLRYKRFPLHPQEVHDEWYKPYAEIINLGLDGRTKDRKMAQMNHTLNMYNALHYGTEPTGYDKIEAAMNFAGRILVEEGKEEARAFISELVQSNLLRDSQRDEAFDRLTELSVSEWKEEWREAIHPDPELTGEEDDGDDARNDGSDGVRAVSE